MPNNINSNELLEKIYNCKLNNIKNNNRMMDNTNIIPSFFYDEEMNKIIIELKEDKTNIETQTLNKFYNNLQEKNNGYTSKEITIEINGDNNIYDRIIKRYIDIFHFINRPNIKYYTKKYYKEKILVELKTLEEILEYSIKNDLKIQINTVQIQKSIQDLEIKYKIDEQDKKYYMCLNININEINYIIYTLNYMYICYKNVIYKYIKKEDSIKYQLLMFFLEKYQNKVYIANNDLTNFFSLIYKEESKNIEIDNNVYNKIKKYIPDNLKAKLYLDYNEKNYLIAQIKFCYSNIEFNPIEQEEIKVNRDILQENIILNKLIESKFLLDKKNKILIITNNDDIFEFLTNIEDYTKILQVYTTTNFNIKSKNRKRKTAISVKINNNLLEINFDKLPINKNEIKEVLQNYRLKKNYFRLKDGTFINLRDNEDLKFIDNLLENLDVPYKNIEQSIHLPINRSIYLEKMLNKNNAISVESNEEYKEFINNFNKIEDNVPEQLENILRDYQKIGYCWLNLLDKYNFGGILADDMGLGKTIQILSILIATKQKEKKRNASLVVAPSSLLLNWKKEAEKFAKQLDVLIINGTQDERKEKIKKIDKFDLVITSYDLLKRDINEYENLNYTFRFAIADEAQYIKNNNTQNSKAIKKIKAKTRYALTGTPIENSLSELWSIFDFIMPDYLFTYKKFRKNYEQPIVNLKDIEALNKLKMLIEPFILRRTKREVLKELPDKITTILNNEMTLEQEKIYLSYLLQARNELNKEIEIKGFENSRIKVLALLTRLRQICCHPSLFISNYKGESGKLNQCMELVKDGIKSEHKILLFSGYTSMFNIIEKKFKNENIKYLKLTGKTEVKARFNLIDEFNNNSDIKVFLISLKAGGTGINLTSADMVIHYDPWWNLSVENQATDRTHRIGQNKKVQVCKLITKNSIEEKIYELQQRKAELIDNMLSTNIRFINKLSKEEILKLFE